MRSTLLRLILTFNGFDAGVTTVLFWLHGPSIELNPAMRLLLEISPFLFLAVKFGVVFFVGNWLASRPGRYAKIGLWLVAMLYTSTIFYQVHQLMRP